MSIESGTHLNTELRRLAAVGALVLAGTATAQTPGIVRPEAIRAHVEYLADDLLEGRSTGSRGHALAAAYVAAQFKQLGLSPAGDKSGEETSFLQTVRLLEATPVLPGSAAKWSVSGNTTTFEYHADYLPFADYSAPNSTLTAPLAFAGFGITAPEAGYDDLASVDVRDRIAVVLSGAPAKFPLDQRAFYSWTGAKFENLIAHGALGVIIVDTPVDTVRSPWERRVKMSWQPQMRWLNGNDQPVDAYPELKQQFRFNHAAAAKLFQNGTPSLEDVFATAETGEAQGFLLPGMMTLTSTTGLRRTESQNVVAMLRGADPVLRRQFIVISAHLDHLGRGAAVNGDAVYNGAHDNATGVGVLLEMARSIVASDSQPKRSILFMTTTAEEKELLGAEFFARHPTVPKNAIVANVNINMPLFLGPTRDFVVVGGRHSTLGPAAQRSVRAQGYAVSADNAPEEVRLIRGDQFAFLKQGIPAIHLSSGYQARSQGPDIAALRQEFFRDHYHQPSDDLLLPIHYPSAVDLSLIGARLVIDIANQAERPRFNRGDFFGAKFGISNPPRAAAKRPAE